MDEGERISIVKKERKMDTRAIHAGREIDGGVGAVSTPIYQTSTYRQQFPGDESGYVYSRTSNPTRHALETALAELEGGRFGFAFASGLAATNTVMNLLSAGDHLVVGDDLYGGTFRLFEKVFKQFQLTFTYVDGRRAENFAGAIRQNTKLLWLETPSNPLMHLTDIAEVAKIARESGILLAVDNTFATPYIQRPLELGADIVVHSLTKYLAGHCDMVGGAVVTDKEELAERIGFYQNAVGAILGPFDSFLALRGLKTLPVRMERHSYNARKIAEFLKQSPLVKEVYYPGTDGKPLPNRMTMAGGMVSFVLDAEMDTVREFVMATSVFILAESLGGVESLINHPATMTHASIPAEIRKARGIDDGLVRLSVGLEDVEDLIDDLKGALAASEKRMVKKG